jgi:hypothetical protein
MGLQWQMPNSLQKQLKIKSDALVRMAGSWCVPNRLHHFLRFLIQISRVRVVKIWNGFGPYVIELSNFSIMTGCLWLPN